MCSDKAFPQTGLKPQANAWTFMLAAPFFKLTNDLAKENDTPSAGGGL